MRPPFIYVLVCVVISWLCALGSIVWLYQNLRKRRWWDLSRLGKPAVLSADKIETPPPSVRDMQIGQEAYVSIWNLVTNKRNQIFVSWTATVQQEPSFEEQFWIKRLKKGFSVKLQGDYKVRAAPILWGLYAPVIEVLMDVKNEVIQ